MNRRAVVTGLGFITSIGHDRATVGRNLRELRHGFEPVEFLGNPNLPVKVAGTVKGFSFPSTNWRDWRWPDNFSVDRELIRGLAPHGVYAVCALQQALAEAGLDPAQLGDGATFRWRMKGHGLTLKPRCEIVEFDAPAGYEEEVRVPGLVRATLSKQVIAQKRRTQLSWSLDYRVVGGPLGVVVDWLIAHRVAERAVQNSLDGAKRVLETRKQPATTRGGYRRQTAVP